MRKTPSYLKGLAENRARAAAEVTRYARVLDEIQRRLSVAQADLVACDQLIRRFDARLNPNDIAPIRGWKGHYGKRGDFLQAVQRILQEAAPHPVSTPILALLLQAEFELDFETPTECRRWVRNSVCNRLRKLVQDGSVERLHDWGLGTSEAGSWRWIPLWSPSASERLHPRTARPSWRNRQAEASPMKASPRTRGCRGEHTEVPLVSGARMIFSSCEQANGPEGAIRQVTPHPGGRLGRRLRA